MRRRSGSTKLTTSCQWRKMASPILSIIFLVEVATLQSCSIHFLARSVATLEKNEPRWWLVVKFLFFLARRICIHVSMMMRTDWDLWIVVNRW
jgi:hypothetical protein